MLSSFVFVTPTSPDFPPLRLPYLTTVSQECRRNIFTRQHLRIPISDHIASRFNRHTFPTLAQNMGCIPCDHNSPHPAAPVDSKNVYTHRVLPSSCRGAARCAPACPDLSLASICFFPHITFHFFLLLILSPVVDFRAAIIRGAL